MRINLNNKALQRKTPATGFVMLPCHSNIAF